jgi:hypothetical protein
MTRPKPKEAQASAEMLAPDPSKSVMTGYCAFPSPGSHGFCHEQFVLTGRKACLCLCHDEDPAPSSEGFGGKALTGARDARAATLTVVEREFVMDLLDKAEEVGTATRLADGRPTGKLIR